MKANRYLKIFFVAVLAVAVYIGLDLFCLKQTKGFRPYLILSNLPNDPRWAIPPPSPVEAEDIHNRLNQTFTFLGSGGWCYAFLGEDQKTVLKFYKHTHLSIKEILYNFSFEKLLFRSPRWAENQSYFQEMNFQSCMLLYTQIRQRTGLIHVHLNKTKGLYPPVTLIDAIGIKHTIDLDQTEFLIQQRAELIIPHLEKLMKQGDVETAKRCVEEMILCLAEIFQKGIQDTDSSFRKNFGYIDNHAIAIDLSSFTTDDSLLDHPTRIQEIRTKTTRLARYLCKYQPVLYTHYMEILSQIEKEETSTKYPL